MKKNEKHKTQTQQTKKSEEFMVRTASEAMAYPVNYFGFGAHVTN